MSLNTWSIIIFIVQILFYLSMLWAVSGSANITKLSVMLTSWLIYQSVILWYGIATDQVGFILSFVFNIIVTIVGVLTTIERNKQ
jgi:hypothetical protein